MSEATALPVQSKTDPIGVEKSPTAKAAVDRTQGDKAAIHTVKKTTALPWLKIGAGVLLILCILVYTLRNKILGQPVSMVAASTGDLIQSVVASGRVVTPQRVTVAAQVAARVVGIPVAEGQTVVKGQVLIELDDKDARANVDAALATLAQADARLRQLREVGLPAAMQSLRQSQTNVEQASKQYERTSSLVAQGFISQAQLDEAKRNLDIATSQASAANVQVNTNQSSGSDVALANATAQQSRAGLRLARVKLENDVIRAPADGILIARSIEPGDIVQPGKALMVLAPSGETQIVVQLDEKNLSKLAVGQKAIGSADAFADQRFNAEVIFINPGVDAARGSVEIKLRVRNPPAYLRQDMTVSVDIETARRKAVLVIPTAAVNDVLGDAPWVLVVRGKRTEKQIVKLGLRGDDNIEVLSGVAAGDQLVSSTGSTVTAGQRVRTKKASSSEPSSTEGADSPAARKMPSS
jgi:HlyD family secretion protein